MPRPRPILLLFALLLPTLAWSATQQQPGTRHVGPGLYKPFYPANAKQTVVPLRGFWLDVLPVTNAQFLAFVKANPRWQRGRVAKLFADPSYLQHWQAPVALGKTALPQQPVTYVSWFAARAYCKARGARLPMTDEWEFAASASDKAADGRSDPAWRERILAWYGKPGHGVLPNVGSTIANFWGIQDLHGVIWEWVADFQSTLVANDDREQGDKDRLRFCGSGSLSAQDTTDYASFMRIAFRSSLRGHYTTGTLGFRCAHNDEGVPE
jgi:sulfatase modifying factor 1